MAQFIVLDHSLTGVGGHHYEQAVQFLRAADGVGYAPVLAANRSFHRRKLFPADWRVLSVFQEASFDCLDEYPLDVKGQTLADGQPEGTGGDASCQRRHWRLRRSWLGSLKETRQRWKTNERRQRIERFARGCLRLHRAVHLSGDDRVFLPTTSLFDLLGLVRFLQMIPHPPPVTWHALFHYGFLRGREPEYEAQRGRMERVRRQLRYLLDNLPPGSLRLYATTDKLAEQFDRLELTECGVLPFPVDSQVFEQQPRLNKNRPFRITCAGFLRREKGKSLAVPLVKQLWDEHLATGRMQLVLQTTRRQARRILPSHVSLPWRLQTRLNQTGHGPFAWLKHPLSREDYIQVVRDSDVALFLHDGRAYYTRCSGVLVDMLAAGIPVLVPAGSWLADQIAEPIQQHLESLAETALTLSIVSGDRLAWKRRKASAAGGLPGSIDRIEAAASAGHRVEFGGREEAVVCELPLPAESSALLVSFDWPATNPPGTYVCLRVEWLDEDGIPRGMPAETTLGKRERSGRVASLVQTRGQGTRIRVRISNAYASQRVLLRDVSFRFLAPPRKAPWYAAGQVGLIFANVDQLPDLVHDIFLHHAHYRQTARAFAASWQQRHDARRIVLALRETNVPPRRAVA